MSTTNRGFYEEYWRQEAGRAVENDPLTPRRLAVFRAMVPTGARVLDAGAGSCGTTQLLRQAGYRAVGVELSLEALARRAPKDVPRLQAALESPLPFRDGCFDAVYCAEVLEHLFDPLAAAIELRRVLRPGGLALASVPFHGLVKNVVVAATSFDHHFDPFGQHIRFFSRKTFRALFERAGFEVRHLRPMGRFWPVNMGMLLVAERRP